MTKGREGSSPPVSLLSGEGFYVDQLFQLEWEARKIQEPINSQLQPTLAIDQGAAGVEAANQNTWNKHQEMEAVS